MQQNKTWHGESPYPQRCNGRQQSRPCLQRSKCRPIHHSHHCQNQPNWQSCCQQRLPKKNGISTTYKKMPYQNHPVKFIVIRSNLFPGLFNVISELNGHCCCCLLQRACAVTKAVSWQKVTQLLTLEVEYPSNTTDRRGKIDKGTTLWCELWCYNKLYCRCCLVEFQMLRKMHCQRKT